MIGVVLPTRGMVFTETIQGIIDSFDDYKLYMSHNLPTPDSFNTLTNQAVDDGCDRIFITNDDVVVTPDIVDNLLTDSPVTFCEVPLTEEFSGYYTNHKGEVTMVGTSCLMVKREVFESLKRPYFRTDIRYVDIGGEEHEIKDPKAWGGEEAYFSRKVREAGYNFVHVPGRARHLRLLKLGKHHSNEGLHEIYEL